MTYRCIKPACDSMGCVMCNCAVPEAVPFDDGWRDDEPECSRCGGDGMDPWCDYISPCPKCGGLEA